MVRTKINIIIYIIYSAIKIDIKIDIPNNFKKIIISNLLLSSIPNTTFMGIFLPHLPFPFPSTQCFDEAPPSHLVSTLNSQVLSLNQTHNRNGQRHFRPEFDQTLGDLTTVQVIIEYNHYWPTFSKNESKAEKLILLSLASSMHAALPVTRKDFIVFFPCDNAT